MGNKFYLQKGNEYIAKKNNLVPIIGLLFFIAVAVSFFIEGTNHDGIPYYVFTFFPIALLLYKIGTSAKINIVTKTVTESFFGLKLREYSFSAISRFILIKKTVNLINAGYGVSIGFKLTGKDEKEIAFSHFNKKKIAEDFLKETQQLMK